MGDALRERWIRVRRNLNPNAPPPEGLYVEPRHGCAASIVRSIQKDPIGCHKYLLVGARGGGKSTELRAIARKLGSEVQLVAIDLDASGVSAVSVSAFDLVYMSALGILRRVTEPRATALFAELKERYAGEEAKDLGDLKTSWGGLAEFAGAASGVVTGMGALAAAAGVDIASATAGAQAVLATGGAALSGIRTGLRLRSKPSGVVVETSPAGRALQDVCNEIARAAREVDQRPLCVLIDGLEMMNGQAGERFRQMFEYTRLVTDTRWTSVIATPPCTLTETNSVDGRGFSTRPVWGFGPDDYGQLKRLLEMRLFDAGLDPDRDVDDGQLDRIAERSGGMPRHAVLIARESVDEVLDAGSPRLEKAHVDVGIKKVANGLGLGVNTEDMRILGVVRAQGMLPGDEAAAKLFSDGRILAHPPEGDSPLPRFVVHPLLDAVVAQRAQS